MIKLAFKVVITFFLSSYPAGVFAQNFETILYGGSEILYPLPRGFCDISGNPEGILAKEFLDKQKSPMVPDAKLILGLCQPNTLNPMYPWGYVGLKKNNRKLSQETLNKAVGKLLKNEGLVQKLMKGVVKRNSEAMEEVFGAESSMKSATQRIIWADNDSVLVVHNLEQRLDGKPLKEMVASSTTVIDDLFVYTYLYNLQGADLTMKQMSKILLDNAPKLKRLN